jgi:hypothetical protein
MRRWVPQSISPSGEMYKAKHDFALAGMMMKLNDGLPNQFHGCLTDYFQSKFIHNGRLSAISE